MAGFQRSRHLYGRPQLQNKRRKKNDINTTREENARSLTKQRSVKVNGFK